MHSRGIHFRLKLALCNIKILDKVIVENFHGNNSCLFYLYDEEKCVISDVLRKNTVWEKYLHNVFEQYITADSVVLEGGCHVGSHTMKLASLAGFVHAFEPLPSSYELLSKNIFENKFGNVCLHKFALSDRISTSRYGWSADGNPGASGLDSNPMGLPGWCQKPVEEIVVETTTIDELGLEKLDFIKLDIEGYEPLAIKGGLKTISKCMPVITMEVWSDHSGSLDLNRPREVFPDLFDMGYRYGQIGNSPDFIFIHESQL